MKIRYKLGILLQLIGALACTDNNVVGPIETRVQLSVQADADIASIIVQLTGADLAAPILWNLAIGVDGKAKEVVTIPAGSNRRFKVTALDESGIVTRSADTTINLISGRLSALHITLSPILTSTGITVTFGGTKLIVEDTTWRSVAIGDSLTISAIGVNPRGQVMQADLLTWGVRDPNIAEVSHGTIKGKRDGVTELIISAFGASARILVSVQQNPVNILTEPDSVRSALNAAVNSWINTFENMSAGGPLLTQAQTYTSSWNNFNMNFYSSLDADGTRATRGWRNTSTDPARESIDAYWSGYYKTLSKASSVLRSIDHGILKDPVEAAVARVTATLMQGAALSGVALHYDKAILYDEDTPHTGGFADRRKVRDKALDKFDHVVTLASTQTTRTNPDWFNGPTYSLEELGRLASSMAAFLIANWPRNAIENQQADWSRVKDYAARGITSATAFDLTFIGDGCFRYCPEILVWFNAFDSGRVHTRLAQLLDITQQSPWPIGGNPRPNSLDKRMGDGSFGTPAMIGGFGNIPSTETAGTDFAWSSQAPFNNARGTYHQSNIGHIRYDETGIQSPAGIYGGYGRAPLFTATQNDLLWAEGLIRSGGNLALAASLINKTRVGRGWLAPASASAGAVHLLTQLTYEKEIEELGIGVAAFLLRRRTDALVTATPREMPVPWYVLERLEHPIYSWGGPNPINSPTPP